MQITIKCVEFSFNNTLYEQTDGISMGSSLRTALANIFVGFQEARLYEIPNLSLFYKQYVADTFTDAFFLTVNQLHPALTFICEFEHNKNLSFPDVQTSIYHKPTFTGLYTRWGSFCSPRRKINFINTLVHRALMICTKVKFADEFDFIKTTLLKNELPKDVITNTIRYKCMQFSTKPKFGPERCLV